MNSSIIPSTSVSISEPNAYSLLRSDASSWVTGKIASPVMIDGSIVRRIAAELEPTACAAAMLSSPSEMFCELAYLTRYQ